MPVKNEEPITANKIIFGTLAGLGTILSMGMFWWFTGTSSQLNELQISMARNSEVVNNLKEKIEENLKTKDSVITNSRQIAMLLLAQEKLESDLERLDREGFDMSDYETFIAPSIEDIYKKIPGSERHQKD